jgi:Recombinase zinc beta ribbon domain
VLEYNFRQRYGTVEPVTIPGFYPAVIDQELFDRVQEKLRSSAANWRNSYANRTTYLLSGLVTCDGCGRRYLGTAAKGGKFHYYSCGSYLKGGKKYAPRGSSIKTNWRARSYPRFRKKYSPQKISDTISNGYCKAPRHRRETARRKRMRSDRH